MANVQVSHSYDAPRSKVWSVLADIGNVQDISPGIVSSKLENDIEGLGAQRSCDLGKNMGIIEEVTTWEPEATLQFTGRRFWGAPMKKMVATFRFAEDGGKTTVDCDFEYDMKLGFLLNPLAKGANTKAVAAMLAGVESKL